MSYEDIQRFFDAWAEDGSHADMEQEHADVVEQVLAAMGVQAGEVVLDLGCGNGWATRRIAKLAPGVQAIGVDCSPRMIARADELHSFTIRARYDFGTFETLEFSDEHFHRAFSMEALYYSPDLQRALAEICRVLKPGGVADLVLDFCAERPGTAGWPERTGVEMIGLKESEWVASLYDAGFAGVEARRVVDRRGPGNEARFEPSEWHPTWADRVAYHAAGSLWLHAKKGS
jgi:ubiquinone/menaquinone biosynthesis C-methylase UbiE